MTKTYCLEFVRQLADCDLEFIHMVEVRKQPKENISSMLRRFSERLKKSGILIEARESRWYRRPKTKRERRERALVRVQRQAIYKMKARQGS